MSHEQDNHRCPECNRIERFGHWFNCPLDDREVPAHCTWIPGDAIPSCDFDPGCPEHGTPVPARCTVMAVGVGRCTKRGGHRPPGSSDPHTFN